MLRSDAPFYWPLRGSIALQNGSGTPTFTRATAKWMFNDEGKLIKLPSGAIEMRGYRPVINLAGQCSPPSSENFSTGWVKNGVTTPSENTMLVDGTTNPKYILINISPLFEAGLEYCATYRVQYVDIQYIQLVGQSGAFGTGIYCNFDLINGTSNPTGCTATITAVSSGVWDVSITATATATAANAAIAIALVPALSSGRLANFVGDSVKSLGVLRYQIEDVTGQTIKTSSEYVSYGILSAPYHGAGATGVKFFATTKSGAAIPESSLIGTWLNPSATTNNLLYCRDLTNAAWVKTNVTAALNQTGIDNQANSSSLLTATANDATILQTITAAAAAACSGFYVKRSVGTGDVYFTRDGGTNWTDITNLINSSTFTLVKIENTSVLNPQVGFKIATNGDAIIVDAGLNHLGTELSNPIITTGAAVTVNAETITAPTASNFSDTAGTILATVTRDTWATGNGSAVGSATRGLYTSAANSGAQGLDGTNTVSGPSGTPSGTMRIGIRWNNSVMQALTESGFGAAGSYDGSFNLASIAAMAGVRGGIKDIAIWPYSLTNNEVSTAMSAPISTKVSARSIFARRSRNRNLAKYFATSYNGITIGDEINITPAAGTGGYHVANGGVVPNDRQYICDWAWTGTDTDTGFGVPTGAPLESTWKYGCYFIDSTVGFATNDHAGISALATVGFEDAVIRGVSCKALRLHVAAPDNTILPYGYGRQLWRMLQRATTTDISRVTIQQDFYLPDLNTLLSTTRRRLTIFDVKTTGDYRYLVSLIKADATDATKYGVPTGTIGWEIMGDNQTYGGTYEEFFRVTLYNQCAPLTHSVSVPLEEWFGFRVYWKRSASFADLTGGQMVVQIKRNTDTKYITVWDQNSSTDAIYNALYPGSGIRNVPVSDNRNIHMGVDGHKIQRIFRGIYGNYETYPVDVLIANEEFWDGLPDE